jgi:hypothetical protein
MLRIRHVCLLALVLSSMPGCVVYDTPSGYYVNTYPSTFDRAWDAALGALQDVGVRVTSADRGAGIARGSKDGVDVSVSVMRQADGTTRVQFDARSSQNDPGLAQRFSSAYDRRMGR